MVLAMIDPETRSGGVAGKAGISSMLRGLIAVGAAVSATMACAGPPFQTDDPQPTDLHRWEIYNFLNGSGDDGQTATTVGLDLNYGLARDVQMSLTVPFDRDPGTPRRLGDVEVAVKFKVLHQSADNASIDLALFPRAYLTTGPESRHIGLLLPVWGQRDFGNWSVFAGGGYTINPGAGNRNFWQGGAALNRRMGEGFQLGGELFAHGSDQVGERPLTVVNLGSLIHLGGPFSLAISAGKGINRQQTVFYTALKLDL